MFFRNKKNICIFRVKNVLLFKIIHKSVQKYAVNVRMRIKKYCGILLGPFISGFTLVYFFI